MEPRRTQNLTPRRVPNARATDGATARPDPRGPLAHAGGGTRVTTGWSPTHSGMDDDAARLREMYLGHRAAVAGFVRRRCLPDDVEDVVAETFMICWRRLDRVPVGAELPWLYNVAGNLLRNRYRARTRDRELVTLIHPSVDSGDLGEVLVARDALLRLAPRDREVLLLVAWEGLCGPALAAACGCSPTAARVRLHRARQRLQRELDRDDHPPDVGGPPLVRAARPPDSHPLRPNEATRGR